MAPTPNSCVCHPSNVFRSKRFLHSILLLGLALVVITEIYCAVMQMEFQNSDSRVGKGFAVAGIFVFVVCYYGTINSTTWLYGSEVLPVSIRSRVMGLAATAHYTVNVASKLRLNSRVFP